MTIAATMVDIHSHFFPQGLPDLGARTGDPRWPHLVVDSDSTARILRGDEPFRSVSRPCWDVAPRLAEMDGAGVQIQVISPVPIALTTWAEPGPAAMFARLHNDLLAEAVAFSDGRLLGLGTVPLQGIDEAIAELLRFTDLGLLGVEIGTEVQGRELDDPYFQPFFEAAEAMAIPVFVHPTDGGGATRRAGHLFEFGIGMLTDTALAASALVFGGVLERFPGLRIGLAHGCGTFPWAYPRLRCGAAAAGQDAHHLDEIVGLLWVDSLVFDPRHLPLLFSRFGTDHVMLGSDYPFLPPSFGAPEDVVLAALDNGSCTDAQARAVLGHNALAFLGTRPLAARPSLIHSEALQ